MMKKLSKVVCCVLASAFVLVATASETEVEKKEVKETQSVLCKKFPFICNATLRGGNGNGNRPPN